MNNEKVKSHIDALRSKHQRLDEQIDLMESSGNFTPDIEAEISYFKKEKLRIKDEIAIFESKIK